MPERRTPLYDIHARSAQMIKGGGDYMFPSSYTSPVEEHTNTRTNVGMQDLSTMGEVDIKGPGAERLINRLLVNDIRDMEPGHVRYSTICREDGGIVDDVTVYKFDDEQWMIVTSSGPRKRTHRWIAEHARGTSTYVTDLSAAIALPVIQGPRSLEFLQSVTDDIDLAALRFFRFGRARIGETELVISRSGYTGELGYELYTPADEAAVLWEHLLKAGRTFGLLPYGVQAMQSLRIEKALPLYGPDLSEDVTPFHVGLDRWINFTKRDFVGRDALLGVQEHGLDERWVGLVLHSDTPAAANDPVYSVGDVATFREEIETGSEAGTLEDAQKPGRRTIGRITSSARGYTVGKTLALAFLRTSHAWSGCRVTVMLNGRAVPATVTATPFYDPGGLRLRSTKRVRSEARS
jgi:aminomethyltransferase